MYGIILAMTAATSIAATPPTSAIKAAMPSATALTAPFAAAAPAPAAATPAAGPFDSRTAAGLLRIVTSHGASGTIKATADGVSYIEGQAATLFFNVYFYGCDAAKTTCNSAVYTSQWDDNHITTDQMNRWNRYTILCPGYLTEKNEPTMWVGLHLDKSDTPDLSARQFGDFLDCASDFSEFVADPENALKKRGV